MKRSRLSYDEWKCILSKELCGCRVASELITGYIDMIAAQGIDAGGIPYFDDLYLDLVVYPDGTVLVDDMEELEEALKQKDISLEQFELALATSDRLQKGLLSDISDFAEYTKKCLEMIR